jgi:hypothetical protein
VGAYKCLGPGADTPLPPRFPSLMSIYCVRKKNRWMEGIEGLTEVENGVDH